jgi:colicin import membrane protein
VKDPSVARKLKTYQTSVGFFDLAIAAPSMKAAAEAWGSHTDVFRRGFAKETQDPAIVAATMARPGVVLKRPVGSNEPFSEHAALPRLPNIDSAKESPTTPRYNRKEPPTRKTEDKTAALAFEREQKRREAARRKEEAAQEKRRKQRADRIAVAEGAFQRAEREHERKVKEIEQDRVALDERAKKEGARWEKQKRKLESTLRRARD